MPSTVRRLVQRIAFLSLAACAITALPGCEDKSPCEEEVFQKPEFPWDTNLGLIPPNAKVCGQTRAGQLVVAFAKDDRTPFVTVVKHLEDTQGFSRTNQDVSNKDLLSVGLEKGDKRLLVHVSKFKGVGWQGGYRLNNPACSGTIAKDFSTCKDDTHVVQCRNGNFDAEVMTCKPGEWCMTNEADGSTKPAEKAHCRPRP